jgi:hypothetical protein
VLIVTHGIGLESLMSLAEGTGFVGAVCDLPHALPGYAELLEVAIRTAAA